MIKLKRNRPVTTLSPEHHWFDAPLAWLYQQPWLQWHGPGWLWRLLDTWSEAYLRRTLDRRLLAAQASGVGITSGWAEPGTPPLCLLAWVEEHLAAIPGAQLLDWTQVTVFAWSEAEWERHEAGEAIDSGLPLVQWYGPTGAWWHEGWQQIAGALPQQHAGLAVVVNRLGAALAEVQPC